MSLLFLLVVRSSQSLTLPNKLFDFRVPSPRLSVSMVQSHILDAVANADPTIAKKMGSDIFCSTFRNPNPQPHRLDEDLPDLANRRVSSTWIRRPDLGSGCCIYSSCYSESRTIRAYSRHRLFELYYRRITAELRPFFLRSSFYRCLGRFSSHLALSTFHGGRRPWLRETKSDYKLGSRQGRGWSSRQRSLRCSQMELR